MAAPFADLADGVCVSDGQGRLLYLNPAAERLLGVSAEQAAGRSVCDLICAHLAVPGSAECASACPLRKPADEFQAVTFTGQYNRRPAYRWVDLGVQRLKQGQSLHVRCLRMPLADGEPGVERHFTFLEDV